MIVDTSPALPVCPWEGNKPLLFTVLLFSVFCPSQPISIFIFIALFSPLFATQPHQDLSPLYSRFSLDIIFFTIHTHFPARARCFMLWLRVLWWPISPQDIKKLIRCPRGHAMKDLFVDQCPKESLLLSQLQLQPRGWQFYQDHWSLRESNGTEHSPRLGAALWTTLGSARERTHAHSRRPVDTNTSFSCCLSRRLGSLRAAVQTGKHCRERGGAGPCPVTWVGRHHHLFNEKEAADHSQCLWLRCGYYVRILSDVAVSSASCSKSSCYPRGALNPRTELDIFYMENMN